MYCKFISFATFNISEIGAHILSGNVFDPRAIEELFPGEDWKEELLESQSSHATPVVDDQFLVLTEESSYQIPNILLPKQLHNEGNFIISLGQVSLSVMELILKLSMNSIS
jgi:electron-transferring-flavoprotein dehydrogenase